MRLLIYLLALLGGFSAAQAARAEIIATSPVAQSAVAVADTVVSDVARGGVFRTTPSPVVQTTASGPKLPFAVVADTPVTRFDAARE